ncbi:hypothetical protein TNCV_260041 [Trichonephila clavipes]|uniref:Uncharacterized protein n=1 Tax=Trichonephila clavipes TaxID=2585209 RepID=A0A8X6RVN0_TRICX|nr:hypothetical protein TNCV_260041 [Trichonephila clavipes]
MASLLGKPPPHLIDLNLWKLTPDVVWVKDMSLVTPVPDGEKVTSDRYVNLSYFTIEYIIPPRARLVTSSSLVPLKTHRVGQRWTLNLSRGETS